jgi:cytidyltransferase-like protein
MSLDTGKTIVVSGYFDPLHKGHIEYLTKAREFGDRLVVIVNSDHQAKLKKGRSFMPEDERLLIVSSLKVVDKAILSIDQDRTVCETIASITPTPYAFCNGGDQNNDSIPETDICKTKGIELIDGLGDKIQSSSWLTGIKSK